MFKNVQKKLIFK